MDQLNKITPTGTEKVSESSCNKLEETCTKCGKIFIRSNYLRYR
ncbi:hypothetical protein [Clostridium acetobutylicum]|nr:hypothetical protein [Clostridium acetobutylicum]NRY58834.1 hypothetical protein [Clostridium acetobutylicum]